MLMFQDAPQKYGAIAFPIPNLVCNSGAMTYKECAQSVKREPLREILVKTFCLPASFYV